MISALPTPNRRQFLRRTGIATLAASGPWILNARGATEEKIEVGFMGLNGRGTDLVKEFLASGDANVSWLCDVDKRAIEKAGELVRQKQVRAFKTTQDVRHVLDDRRTQALVIAAPDHWHAPATILALKAGKAVYVEKPLSHNPREGELILDTLRRTRGVVQVGLQRRSQPWVVDAMRRVQGGELGPVHFARAWYANKREGIGFGQLAPVPGWLDYDLWQGPAPEKPFRDNVVHYNWHWFWHWGTGELGNNGVHFLDLARWGMNLDCPSKVSSGGGRFYFEDDQESPDTQVVTYDFADRTIVWEHRSCQPQAVDGEEAGVAFYGRKGTLIIGSSGFRVLDAAGKETERVSGGVPTAPHVASFLNCIRRPGHLPTATAEDGHKSTLLCHLGNIAHRVGHTIRVNPQTRQLRDEPEAAKLWRREYRSGWEPTS